MRKIFCFFAIGVLLFSACGKKEAKKEENKNSKYKTVEEKLNDNAPTYMLKGLTISGFSINDTTNGIKAKVLSPVKRIKDSTFSIKPMTLEVEKQFKQTVAELKEIGKKTEQHNLVIRTVSVVSYNNLISGLFEKRLTYAEEGKKENEFFAITYDMQKNTPLKITEIFNITAENFDKVANNFSKTEQMLSFEEFSTSQFAFSKDSLMVYPIREGKQISISAPLQSLEHYLINDKKE